MANQLGPDQALTEVLTSANGHFALTYQPDGNLVLYRNDGVPLWANQTAGSTPGIVVMQGDGNCVLYDGQGIPLWATGTFAPGSRLFLQDDGNLLVLDPTDVPIWASHTAQVVEPGEPEQPSDPSVDYTIIVIHDQRGRPVEGALVQQSNGDARIADGSGFTHMPSHGTNRFTITHETIEPVEIDLGQGTFVVQANRLGSNHPDPLDGVLAISNEGWRAGGQLRLPLFCHAGDLFMAFCEEKDVDGALDKIAEAGYHGVRFWSPLVWVPENNPFWHNRACSPVHTPDFYGKLRQFIRKLKERNLKTYAACGGLGRASNSEETSYYEELAKIIAEEGPEWFFLPGEVNESRDTGDSDDRSPREIERLVNIIRQRHPQLSYALSAYTGDTTQAQAREWTPSWMGFVYFHGYRDGHYWDKIRHMFSNGYENYRPVRKYAFVGEDVGPGRWLSVTANKHELDNSTMGLIGAMAACAGIGYTYICSPGIIFDEPFETHAGFWNLPKLLRQLPQDLMSFDTLHHGGATWNHTRVFEAVGEFRVDGRIHHDGRFVYVAYGPGNSVNLPVKRACEFDIIDPATADVIDTQRLNAGDTFTLTYHRGVVLRGRTR